MRPSFLGRGRRGGLFVRAREDPASFGDVYSAHRHRVLRFFARRVLDPELSLDLMAETFAETFSRIGEFRGSTDAEGEAFMWSIARTQLALWCRRGEVERRNLERIGIPVPSLGVEEYERIEQLADLERFAPVLERALRELTAAQRDLVQQHVIGGRSYEELADELGTTTVALRNMLSRALRRLSSVLDQYGAFDADDAPGRDAQLIR